MNFITLTSAIDDSAIYVSKNHIQSISTSYGRDTTIIRLVGDSENYLLVLESPETVRRLVEKE